MQMTLKAMLIGGFLAAAMIMDYHPQDVLQYHQADTPAQWSQAIKSNDPADTPKVFAMVQEVQKFLTDRKIGVNVSGDRYELLYKRIY